MSAIAAEARGQPDAKVMALLAWIRKHQCSEKGAWLPRRILIFTEYVDTKTYLVAQLEAAFGQDRARGRAHPHHPRRHG
jgi:ERCC4-related helicase